MNGNILTFDIRLFSVDTTARSFLTGALGHTSCAGCSKCKQKAVRIIKRLSFEKSQGAAKTDADFHNRTEEQYHLADYRKKGSHILESIDIKMVTQFLLDVMHLIDLGVGKKLLHLILTEKMKNKKHKLDANQLLEMDKGFLQLIRNIPVEFCRKPRSFNEIARWKATECRQILL